MHTFIQSALDITQCYWVLHAHDIEPRYKRDGVTYIQCVAVLSPINEHVAFVISRVLDDWTARSNRFIIQKDGLH